MLDFSHLFFTQEDVDGITAKYGNEMAGDILLGTLKPGYEIYALYTKRVDERVAKIKELLKAADRFQRQRDRRIKPSKMTQWPKDEAEADQLGVAALENRAAPGARPVSTRSKPAPLLVSRRS